MTFRVEQSKKKRDSFGNYDYHIYKDNSLIATYWHDYRRDGSGIKFKSGIKGAAITSPFLEGGGPKPHSLSSWAINYLSEHSE